MTTFGASAPINDPYEHFGITTPKIVDAVKSDQVMRLAIALSPREGESATACK